MENIIIFVRAQLEVDYYKLKSKSCSSVKTTFVDRAMYHLCIHCNLYGVLEYKYEMILYSF